MMDLAARLITDHEGLRLRPYRCSAGYLTIGWGHNLHAKGLPPSFAGVNVAKGITVAQATALFAIDRADAERDLDHVAPWVRASLDEVRAAALLDMAFNLGREAFAKFGPTLAVIRAGRYVEAAARLRRTLWHGQVGRRGPRIVSMIETGRAPVDLP